MAHSNLASIPDESFHLMQDDWRLEISDRMQEIRVKENVSRGVLADFRLALNRSSSNKIVNSTG